MPKLGMDIDLREHFGLWGRCRNTKFWKELEQPEYRSVFVNPIDGMMISVMDHPHVGGPARRVIVHDGRTVEHGDVLHAFENNYPWVEKVMVEFFTGLTMIRIGLASITPEEFFERYYEDQTPKYKETGKGHSEKTGKDEVLEATKRVLGALERKGIVLDKIILRDELDEFLEGYGILEC